MSLTGISKKVLFLFLAAILVAGISGEEKPHDKSDGTNESQEKIIDPEEDIDICKRKPTSQGCLILGLAPSIGFNSDGISYGISGAIGVFLVDRLAGTLNGGVARFPATTQYVFGASANYYIGPLDIYYFLIGYGAARIWQRQGNDGDGFLHGPQVSILVPVSSRFLAGISLYYDFIEFEGEKSRKFDWGFSFSYIF